MEKSHVSMEQKVCIATGKRFNSGAILLDKRLKKSMDPNTITGWGVSPEVQEKLDDGYVVFVEIDVEKSELSENSTIQPEGAFRTGNIFYLRRHVAEKMFDTEVQNINFCDRQTAEHFMNLNPIDIQA